MAGLYGDTKIAGSGAMSTVNNTAAQSLQQQQSATPRAAVSPVGKPTSVWARYAQVGAAKIRQLELNSKIALGKLTNNQTAVNNARAQNAQNNQKVTNIENSLKNTGNPIERTVAKVGGAAGSLVGGIVSSAAHDVSGLAKDVNKEIIKPASEQAKQVPGLIAHPSKALALARQHDQLNASFNQAAKTGKISQGSAKLAQALNAQEDVAKMVTKGASDSKVQQFLIAKQKGNTETMRRILGETLGTASLFVGGGEAKGLATGAKETVSQIGKSVAKNATANAGANVGYELQTNPNASRKQLLITATKGVAGGVALGGLGAVVNKANRMVFGKDSSVNLVKNVKTNALVQKGQELNAPKKINVTDQSTGEVKGTVTTSLPKSKVPIVVKDGSRPSDVGYTDAQFRAQFARPAREVVKSSKDTAAAFLKTGSKDPLTLTVHSLADATSSPKVSKTVSKLLPDLTGKPKDQLVKDLVKTKDPQETAHLLWDAAKNHEADINAKASMVGTPMDKKISFKEQSVSEMGGNRPSADIQKQIETAHNAGDIAKTESLIKQLPDASTRDAMRSSVGLPTKETKLVIYPDTGQAERIPIGKTNMPIKSSGESTTSQLSAKVNQKAVENKLAEDLGDVKEHNVMDIKDQAKKATDLITKDEQRAVDIATGKRNAPSGVHPHAVFVAVEKKAIQDGNIDLIRQLAQSKRVDEATSAGQTLRILRERDEDSPVAAIQQISAARTSAVEKRLSQPVAKVVSKTASEIDSHIKRPTKLDWQAFIEGIKC